MAASTTRQGPEPELVSAARDGDAAALDALLAASLPLVYNVVGRALRGHADVDDVVQETMLRVVRGIGGLAGPAAYRSWLVAIALRQVREHDRRRTASAARTAGHDAAREHAEPGSDFAAVTVLRLGLSDQRRDVAEATRWLDGGDRELLALWWLEESGRLERRELADALGLSAPHAAVRVQRMKRRLETAREVVRALRGAGGCRELQSVAEGWDGVPNPLWRKRFARHARGCELCAPRDRALVPVARLLRGLPLVPVPAALVGRYASPASVHTQSLSGSKSLIGSRNPTGRGVRRARRTRPRSFVGAHPILAPAAAMAVAGAVVAGYVFLPAGRQDPSTSSAAATQAAGPSVPDLPSTAAASPTPSASPTRAASPAPSRSAAASKTAAAAAAGVQTSMRKGVGVWSFTGVDQALAESGASWYYTWSSTPQGTGGAKGVGFVPMIWGGSSVTAKALAQAEQSTSCGCVLGFNEPDMSGQSNLSVTQALSLWPQLVATGLKLGSPAVATGAATPGGWLDQFMAGAERHGYRVDFITLHWYGSDFDTSAAVSQLQSYVEAVYNRYHLPIWLTEFALIGFSGGAEQFPAEATQAAFLTDATKMLDGLPYLQRYAWFGLPASSTPSSGLFTNGPDVTPVGRAFETAR